MEQTDCNSSRRSQGGHLNFDLAVGFNFPICLGTYLYPCWRNDIIIFASYHTDRHRLVFL